MLRDAGDIGLRPNLFYPLQFWFRHIYLLQIVGYSPKVIAYYNYQINSCYSYSFSFNSNAQLSLVLGNQQFTFYYALHLAYGKQPLIITNLWTTHSISRIPTFQSIKYLMSLPQLSLNFIANFVIVTYSYIEIITILLLR